MKDTKHVRREFHYVAMVMPQGWDFKALGVPRWSKNNFQTWSCGISNRRGWQAEQNASNVFILWSNWWPWGEVKGQIFLSFGYHVNFKDFYTKLCECSHKWKIQNKSDGIFILSPGSCTRGGTLEHCGVTRGPIFFKHGHVAYQIDGDDEQNRMQVTFLSQGQTGDLGAMSNGQISLTCQFQIFIPNFVCDLTNKRWKTYWTKFSFFCQGHAPGWDLWVLGGVKNFSVGICDGAPSTARSSLFCHVLA